MFNGQRLVVKQLKGKRKKEGIYTCKPLLINLKKKFEATSNSTEVVEGIPVEEGSLAVVELRTAADCNPRAGGRRTEAGSKPGVDRISY